MTRPTPTSDVRYVLGCMSGTSLDGLDVAVVRLSGRGRELAVEIIDHAATPFDDALRGQLGRLAGDQPARPSEIATLARRLGNLHADACEAAVGRLDASISRAIAFVAAHGQTIAHCPASVVGRALGATWQLIDPFPIAERLRVPVCTDLRGADVAAGGEGAPITPAADPVLFPLEAANVVNLGGIANATRWFHEPRETGGSTSASIEGADIGPCNLLLDPLATALLDGARFDADGAVAASGRADAGLVRSIRRRVDLALAAPNATGLAQPRSLGREQFGEPFIAETLREAQRLRLSTPDLLASAVDAIAERIAGWAGDADDVVLAGGGVRNRALVARLADRLPESRVRVSSDFGVEPEAREAAAMAVLAAMAWDGLSVTILSITGASRATPAGRWTLPEPRGGQP